MLADEPVEDKHPILGGVEILPSHYVLLKLGICANLMGHLSCMET